MICRQCGSYLYDDAKFCNVCGMPSVRRNGFAITGFVLGIIGLILCWIPYFNFMLSIPALIFSIIGIKNPNKRALSIIGLCLSAIALTIGLVINLAASNKEKSSTAASSEQLSFVVSDEKEDLSVGEIAKDGDFYYGLACVRSSNKVQTAISSYSTKVSKTQEVIYPIIEVYNAGKKDKSFNTNDVVVYADSVKASDPDTIYLVGIDGIDELQFYEIDSNRTALVVQAFVVDEDWKELKVFCGDISWTLTPDDISTEAYTYEPMFDLSPDYSYTEKDSIIYDEDYELIFDGMEFYEYKSYVDGKETFAVFEFTINNTSDEDLDYSLVGYKMKGYWNTQLLDDATYIMDENISGYTNVYNIGEVRSGMKAKVYVAFEVPDDSGDFECYYDVGYLISDRLGYVCIHK